MMCAFGSAGAMARETSAMTGWPEVEPEWPNSTASGRNRTACATMSAVGIGPNSPSSSRTCMAVVDQRPADREQPERRQVIVRDAAADRRMRDIDEKDAHGLSVRTCSSVSAADVRGGWWVAPPGEKDQAALGTGLIRLRHVRNGAEAALAPMEFADRGGEVVGIEVRPHPVGEVELGIGALPQQEVREALLAAGADQQIDVAAMARRVAGDEAAEALARELGAAIERGRRVQDGVARRVVERDAQMQLLAVARSAPPRPRCLPPGRPATGRAGR